MSGQPAEVQAGLTGPKVAQAKEKKDYKGFVAGVFSGIAKLSGESCQGCHARLIVLSNSSDRWANLISSVRRDSWSSVR